MELMKSDKDITLLTDKAYDLMIKKDTSKLDAKEKLQYCANLCKSLGLNPLTQPFEFIRLNGKETPYAKKDATDQLRKIYGISLEVTSEAGNAGIYMVRAKATTPQGRTDMATGVVNIQGLKGDALCNAIMKAETKAKRRVTLSICGLGFLDESEFDTIPSVKRNETAPEPQPAQKEMILGAIKQAIKKLTNEFKDHSRLQNIYKHIEVKTFDDLKTRATDDLLEIEQELLEICAKEEGEEAKKYSEETLDMGF